MSKHKVINLFAGPGVGKSTTAAALFAELKYIGVNCEYIPEYAKDAAWEKRSEKFFKAQQLIYGKQSWRIERVASEVDIIITDSPLPLSLAYIDKNYAMPALRDTILQDFDRYDNINVLLGRNKPYNSSGRNQNLEQAKKLDNDIASLLIDSGLSFEYMEFGRDNVTHIIELMLDARWDNDIPTLKELYVQAPT